LITSPEKKEFNLKDEISFRAEVNKPEDINRGQVLWEFGDGGLAYALRANYTFKEAGIFISRVSIRDKHDCHTSYDTIELTITECLSDNDCTDNSLCCNNVCEKPACLTNADCNQEDPLITGETCNNIGSCDAYCFWDNCSIRCDKDSDCNDLDESTTDFCTTPGTCGSRCLNQREELLISIISPGNEVVYDTNIILFKYSTNMEADCQYQLNSNNRERLYTNNFEIEVRPGNHILRLFCDDKTAESLFTVSSDTSLMDDLTGEPEESIFDFLKKRPLVKATEQQITSLLGKIIKDEGIGYELKRELNLKDNKSVINLGLKNIKTFLALKNVELTVTIPKQIADNANKIKSSQDFITLEADPIIKHTIQNIDTGSSESISYTIDNQITEDLLNQIIADIKVGEVTDQDIEEVKEKIENTQDATEITKRIIREAGKTKVTTTIVPKGVLMDTKVFLDIPKCMAERLNEVAFQNKNFKVISDDPLIVWHFTELSNKLELSYEIGKDIDEEDCERQSVVLALAEQIEAMEKASPASYWRLILAALVVPIVGFGVIYLHKFTGRDEALDDVVERTAEIVKQDLATGRYKEDDIKLALLKKGWNSEMVDKIFKKVK